MWDDLDRIESAYGSVAEYYRSMREETYEEHMQSVRMEDYEERISKADDNLERWDMVLIYDEGHHAYDHLLTDKEKLKIEYEDYRNSICWGVDNDMWEWVDRKLSGDQQRVIFIQSDSPNKKQNESCVQINPDSMQISYEDALETAYRMKPDKIIINKKLFWDGSKDKEPRHDIPKKFKRPAKKKKR